MPPHLIALATDVPPHRLDQQTVVERAAELLRANSSIERMLPVFANAGISRRFSCVPLEWFGEGHKWRARNALYLEHSLALLAQTTQALLEQAKLPRDAIDIIVTVSTTGIATPSLDALLIDKLELKRSILRLPIFGLGCAGGVLGLSRAADLARAHPGKTILLLVVELCTLQFRKDDSSKSNTVAAALFADGAAGALVSTEGDGPVIGPGGEFTWPNTLDVMGWDVEDDGLRARFSASIPALVRTHYREAVDAFLSRHALSRDDIDRYACHPGGAKVLDALEEALNLTDGGLIESRETLRDYGNMSAVTVLFVLSRMDWRNPSKRTLLGALGPGFTGAFQLLGES